MNRVLLGVLVLLVLGVGAIASILWTKDRPAAPAEAAAPGTDARDDPARETSAARR